MAKKTNKTSEWKKLTITLTMLLLILGGFIVFSSLPLHTGKTIILKTLPLDPFDPFRGQYMQINYEISNLPAPVGVRPGDTVYVVLAEDTKGIWNAQDTLLEKPQGTYIKGTVHDLRGKEIRIEYGIESYFFEKGAELPTENITMEVKVDSRGNARIVQMRHNDEPIQIKYREVGLTS